MLLPGRLYRALFLAALGGLCAAEKNWPDLSLPPKGLGGGEKDAALIVGAEAADARAWRVYFDALKVPPERVSLSQDGPLVSAQPGGTLWFIYIGDGRGAMPLLRRVENGRQAKTVALLDAPRPQRYAAGPRTVLIAGGGPTRPAFSYLALGALRGWGSNPGGVVTAWSLTDFIRRQLAGERAPELLAGSPGTILGIGHELEPFPQRFDPEAAAPKPRSHGPGDAGLLWVKLPGGRFMMGSEEGASDEKPVHAVTLKTFELAKSPVTFGQYRKCVEAGACSPAHVDDGRCSVYDGKDWGAGRLPDAFRGDDQPAVCVDWAQARDFSAWAGGRLPSEAEWEYAARGAGGKRRYPWGDETPDCAKAVINDGEPGCGRKATWPVCSKPKGDTAHGLCDMAGNVVQWVADAYRGAYDAPPSAGIGRVGRGSSWYFGSARTSSRNHVDPGDLGVNIGFRPARP